MKSHKLTQMFVACAPSSAPILPGSQVKGQTVKQEVEESNPI